LAKGHKKRQGRGYKGHITMRHRGGGVKKRMRVLTGSEESAISQVGLNELSMIQ